MRLQQQLLQFKLNKKILLIEKASTYVEAFSILGNDKTKELSKRELPYSIISFSVKIPSSEITFTV